MKIEEAIEFLQRELIESSYFNPTQREKLNNIIILLNRIQKENIELKETIKGLRWEGDEYDKKLNRIDELALIIEDANERIRNNI